MATAEKDSKRFSCRNEGCFLTFNNRMSKKRHLDSGKCKGVYIEKPPNTIIKNNDGTYLCTDCGQNIVHQNNTSRHKKLCKKSERKSHQCTVCGNSMMK